MVVPKDIVATITKKYNCVNDDLTLTAYSVHYTLKYFFTDLMLRVLTLFLSKQLSFPFHWNPTWQSLTDVFIQVRWFFIAVKCTQAVMGIFWHVSVRWCIHSKYMSTVALEVTVCPRLKVKGSELSEWDLQRTHYPVCPWVFHLWKSGHWAPFTGASYSERPHVQHVAPGRKYISEQPAGKISFFVEWLKSNRRREIEALKPLTSV